MPLIKFTSQPDFFKAINNFLTGCFFLLSTYLATYFSDSTYTIDESINLVLCKRRNYDRKIKPFHDKYVKNGKP